jgi:hypothetical protein
VDEYPTLGPLKSTAVSGLGVVFKDTYSTGILQVWDTLIDIHSILFFVEFENGLLIAVLRNRVTRYKFYN